MDRDDLMSLFNKAQNGDIEAQFTLGQCFLAGDGVEEDSEIAASMFAEAANAGHTEAQYMYGLMNRYGQ